VLVQGRSCRVPRSSEGLKQRGRQPIRRRVRGGSPAMQLRALQTVVSEGRCRWRATGGCVAQCRRLCGAILLVIGCFSIRAGLL
jgi:hypothetical protein